jgi:hypothetical protein
LFVFFVFHFIHQFNKFDLFSSLIEMLIGFWNNLSNVRTMISLVVFFSFFQKGLFKTAVLVWINSLDFFVSHCLFVCVFVWEIF